MSQLRRATKRVLPYTAMGITLPPTVPSTYSFKIPRIRGVTLQEAALQGGHLGVLQRDGHRQNIDEVGTGDVHEELEGELRGVLHHHDVGQQQGHLQPHAPEVPHPVNGMSNNDEQVPQDRQREQQVQRDEHAHRGEQFPDFLQQLLQNNTDISDEDNDSYPNEEPLLMNDPNDYFNILKEFSKKWLAVQLTHKVSLNATDKFWSVALRYMGRLLNSKKNQNIKRKIPQFTNQRRKLFREDCPTVHMKFAYKHNSTDDVVVVENVDYAPICKYENNSSNTKLYEEAYVKVLATVTLNI